MRTEFDPTFNGGHDKLRRYHQEARDQAALREVAGGSDRPAHGWWGAAVGRVRQLFHLPALPAARQ
ncbi:hypothetical protein [Deinococcus navajonensis]|uniref:Uncharacterized protein n=1 Tax=Deinococcus navajonensis TaxID=309884 RepID=A0ABV8XNT9_9DEIO